MVAYTRASSMPSSPSAAGCNLAYGTGGFATSADSVDAEVVSAAGARRLFPQSVGNSSPPHQVLTAMPRAVTGTPIARLEGQRMEL